MKAPVEILPAALDAIKRRLSMEQLRCVRLGVQGGGCSGFSYVLRFGEPVRPGDITWTVDDVTFVVDNRSTLHLSGSRLSWKKTLLTTGFEFENPNESSRCGCGASFSMR